MIVIVLPDISLDTDHLARARRGNKQAIAEIYERYVEPLYQFVRLRTGDAQLAEDVVSTVFVKFMKALSQGKGPRTNLRAWLFTVARHEIYDHYGGPQPVPIEHFGDWVMSADDNQPERSVFLAMDIEAIRKAIAALAPDYQEVLILRFDQRLSLQETADIMGKKLNTVKSLQLRALAQLRGELLKYGVKE